MMRAQLYAWFAGPDGWPRRRRYLLAAISGTIAIWTVALAVMLLWPRSFTVESSLILPSSDPDARVDLKEVGQAYATTRSMYDAKSLDPRVNYREIMLSADVLQAAAVAAGMAVAAFGEPRIKLIDQSSVIEVRVSGASAEQALAKSRALQAAFQARLTALRQDDQTQRELAIERAIRASRDKLSSAQQELVRFKVGAQVVTEKQLDEMALASTALARRSLELAQKLSHDRATVSSLSSQLGVSARIAGWTLTLQGDAVFLEHIRQFSTAAALLADYGHKWGENHPKVREAAGTRAGALTAMVERARGVLGQTISAAELQRMAMVLVDRSRELLLRELVSAQAAAEAAAAELAQIERQRAQLARELPRLAAESAQLDELQRRVNFSEAVFTGAVGKTDVGSTSIFSSYPMVQTLVAPALPLRPSAPRFAYVASGAFAASLLLAVGLALAWLRNKS